MNEEDKMIKLIDAKAFLNFFDTRFGQINNTICDIEHIIAIWFFVSTLAPAVGLDLGPEWTRILTDAALALGAVGASHKLQKASE